MTRMDCSEVCDLLPAFADGELAADEERAIAAHLEGCPGCAARLAQLKALSRRIKTAGTFTPPPGLEQRVRAAIGVADREGWAWQRVAMLVASHAAVAVLAAALAYGLAWRTDQREGLLRDVVSAHVRSLAAGAPVQIASSDTHTVKPWFAGKLPFAPIVRDLSGSGFPLIGGRVDYVLDRPAAALVYGRRKHRIDVLVLPAGQLLAPGEITGTRNGYNVLGWQAGEFAYLAVSDLNMTELGELARELRADGGR